MAAGRPAEAQQFLAQAFPGDAQQFRGPALVALTRVEGPLHQQAFRLLQVERFLDDRRLPERGTGCPYAAVARQGGQQLGGKIEGRTTVSTVSAAARSISLLSSRTLPGQS